MFIKDRGLMALPITTGFSVSLLMKPQRKTAQLYFKSFQPEYLPTFKQRVLLGIA
jgi:hypothetical protein